MKKTTLLTAIILTALLFGSAFAQEKPDEKLFQQAKVLLFDEKWESAEQRLEELMKSYPDSPLYSQALFYRAKCLSKQRGKEREALEAYKRYIQHKDRNRSLVEESEISIIDMASALHSAGEKSYLEEIEKRLRSADKVVRYYAAFKMSYMTDKKVASKSVSALKQIIEQEKDQELKDRAKIALLRVSPEALREVEIEKYESTARILKIRIYIRGKKEAEVSINIPWALADLALSAIPEKDRTAMKKQGYDLDKIIRDLTRTRGNIIEIREEDRIIKIWID